MTCPLFIRRLAGRHWHGPGGLAELLPIALPMVVSSASDTLMLFWDRWLLSQRGMLEMSAAFSGGLTSFLTACFFLGVLGSATPLASQYLGAGRPERAGAVLGQSLLFTCMAAPLLPLSVPLAGLLFRAFGHQGELLRLELDYYFWMSFAHIPMLFKASFGAFFTALGRTRLVMAANLGAALLNVPLAWLLITGGGFFEGLGLKGAAIATGCAGMLGVALLASQAFSPACRREFGTFTGLRRDGELFRRLLRFGLPGGAEFLLMMAGFNGFILAFQSAGILSAAAVTICFNWELLAFLPMTGLQVAVSSVSARCLGAEDPASAERAAFNGLRLAWGYSSLMALIFLVFAPQLAGIFASRDGHEAAELASSMLRLCAIYLLADSAHLIFGGVLKGAGDVRFPLVTSTLIFWGLAGLTLLGVRLGFGPLALWGLFIVAMLILGSVLYLRFRLGPWRGLRMIEN
ncbi:MAG: hypothetical protein RL095_905 [Verrucomicrobiota bacterium]